ncbi:MAG: hypothetical protein KDA53_16815 [Hyphomonas sp.]|nr:hypothetical protein [Hyphomonas sp.]
MSFAVPTPATSYIAQVWAAIRRQVDDDLESLAASPMLPRRRHRFMTGILNWLEPMVRRLLVLLAASVHAAGVNEPTGRLLFRIDETPPEPVIPKTREEDPDYFFRERTPRTPPHSYHPDTDGLVSSAGLIRRLKALQHVFAHEAAYIAAMRARLRAPIAPLLAAAPKSLLLPGMPPDHRDSMLRLHEEAVAAQARLLPDTS